MYRAGSKTGGGPGVGIQVVGNAVAVGVADALDRIRHAVVVGVRVEEVGHTVPVGVVEPLVRVGDAVTVGVDVVDLAVFPETFEGVGDAVPVGVDVVRRVVGVRLPGVDPAVLVPVLGAVGQAPAVGVGGVGVGACRGVRVGDEAPRLPVGVGADVRRVEAGLRAIEDAVVVGVAVEDVGNAVAVGVAVGLVPVEDAVVVGVGIVGVGAARQLFGGREAVAVGVDHHGIRGGLAQARADPRASRDVAPAEVDGRARGGSEPDGRRVVHAVGAARRAGEAQIEEVRAAAGGLDAHVRIGALHLAVGARRVMLHQEVGNLDVGVGAVALLGMSEQGDRASDVVHRDHPVDHGVAVELEHPDPLAGQQGDVIVVRVVLGTAVDTHAQVQFLGVGGPPRDRIVGGAHEIEVRRQQDGGIEA